MILSIVFYEAYFSLCKNKPFLFVSGFLKQSCLETLETFLVDKRAFNFGQWFRDVL